ncbi:MAG TPA: DUF6636 domain-containing protein [Solirubrobacterales bacterium]|nr:DUF6636 domain-containing protein [Solirubrobacterales bacterium]
MRECSRLRGSVLAAAALVFAGCGGGETTVIERTVVERPSDEATTDADPTTPAPQESDTIAAPDARFQTPSGNIVCSVSSEAATCEILRKRYTPSVPRPADCPLDYGHRLTVDAAGVAGFSCYGDSMSEIAEGSLPYGNYLKRGSISCVSQESGLTCRSRNGGGFFLSVDEATLFG